MEKRIRTPSLIVVGEKDGIREHSEYLSKTLPDSRFLVVQGCDHSVVLHRPEYLADEISRFQHQLLNS